jgi:hypothetical protein
MSGKLVGEALFRYHFIIKYRPGMQNTLADADTTRRI